ncbi:MAG: hypothetical protein FWG80_01125 [Alphaproteobacteria bacterium]|nr:hypothetical protein [Alphaproteobacteria bacterium]
MITDNSTFCSENILLSVAGHLGIVAIMVTSFAVMGSMVKIVAPDHIQIIEIDLSKVQITKDETLVHNTETPEKKENEKQPEKEPEEKDWQAEDKPKPKKPEPVKEKPKPAPPTPVQKTTVRVNRETASLNRTMTVSVIDALRVAMTRCWQFDNNRSGIEDLRVVAHLTMNRNGMVSDIWFEGAGRAETDPAFAYIVETIRSAISVCQPFRMLPPNEYDFWKNIQLTFYPSNATVQ